MKVNSVIVPTVKAHEEKKEAPKAQTTNVLERQPKQDIVCFKGKK